MRFINLTCKIARWTCSSVRGSNEPSKPIGIKKIHSHLIKWFINPEKVIITSWVDKYRVKRYQESTIVLLNALSSIIYQLLCTKYKTRAKVVEHPNVYRQQQRLCFTITQQHKSYHSLFYLAKNKQDKFNNYYFDNKK